MAFHKADSGYQVITGIDEMSSIKKSTPMLASWLAIIKAQIEFIPGEHSTGETLKNIVTNIEGNIEESLVFSNGKGICLRSSRQAILNLEAPANVDFVNDCQQGEPNLDSGWTTLGG